MFSWLSGSGKRQGEGASFGQSPSAPPDARGRLNFSSLGTPRPPAAVRLTRENSGTPLSDVSGSRLGQYHHSRQSPAVLDQFISSQSPQSLYKNSPAVRSTSERFNLLSSPQSITTGFSPLSRRAQTPFRRSPFQSNQNTSPFGTGLVGMVVRSRLHQSQGPGVSPVMVHLPGSSSTSLNESDKDTAPVAPQSSGGNEVDPCDREVVISALKQKRKRWVCQAADDVTGNTESQPAAKRSRHTTEQTCSSSLSPTSLFGRPSLHSRKRDHTSSGGPLTSSLSQSLKKPRVFIPPSQSPWKQPVMSSGSEGKGKIESEDEGKKMDTEVARVRDHVTMPETGQPRERPTTSRFVSGSGTGMGRSLKLSVPESEYESDSESVRGGGVKGDGVEESSVDSGRGSRGSTPPVQDEEEEESREEERNRRNRAELQRLHKSLTAVFPSAHRSSSRRKLPAFCATGSVCVPSPALASSRGVTREDWRKEGEMARARLRSFLAADDDPPTKPPSTSQVEKPTTTTTTTAASVTTTSSSTSSSSSSSSSSSQANLPSSTTTTSVTTSVGMKLPGGKSVTFQLPNVATSTQSLSSASSSQTTSTQVSGSGSGMGPGAGMGLRLGSEPGSATAASLLPPPSYSSTTSQSTSSTLSLTCSSTTQQQQQQPQQQQQEGKQQQQQQQPQQQQQEGKQQQQQQQQPQQQQQEGKQQQQQGKQQQPQNSQQAVVQTTTQSLLPLDGALGLLQTTPTTTPSQTIPTTSLSTLVPSSLPSLSQLQQLPTNLPSQQSTTGPQLQPSPALSLTQTQQLLTSPALSLPQTQKQLLTSQPQQQLLTSQPQQQLLTSQPQQQLLTSQAQQQLLTSQPQQQLLTSQPQQLLTSQAQQQLLTSQPQQQLLTPQQQLLSSVGPPQRSSSTAIPVSSSLSLSSSQSTKLPGFSLGFGGSMTPGGLKFGPGGGLGLMGTTSAGSGSGSGNGNQTTTSGQNRIPQLQLTTPAQQNSAPGGITGVGQLPTTSSTGVPPSFNFGGGFKFSAGGPSLTQAPQQQKPTLVFGGATPQTQNPTGGLIFGGSSGVGGAFGTVTTTTIASATGSLTTPTFNFSATSSSSSPALGAQKLSGGIFGGSSLQPPSVALPTNPLPPTFNFGAATSQPTQQQQQRQLSSATGNNSGGGMFNFSANLQKQSSSLTGGGGLMFGGGGASSNPAPTATGPVFNFSATGSQTGSKASGSGTGLSFGATPSVGSGGFNFSAAAPASNTTGGLNFGGGVAFGGSTNQIQPGGIFGQNTPSNNPSSTASVFNPSLATPSKPPQVGGFNFTPQPSVTPQPSSGGFNFGAAAAMGTPGGINFGSPGVGGGTLFSAGTPPAGERPVATARRRNRGRRK